MAGIGDRIIGTAGLYECLVAEGFKVPDHCRNVTLQVPIGDVFVLNYEVIVTADELGRLGRALAKLAESAREAA